MPTSPFTSEVGKPIRESRNELNGLLGRIDFFLAETERTLGLLELLRPQPAAAVVGPPGAGPA